MENKAITVNIPRWETDSLELICGIANAGGGYVLLPTSQKDYSSGLRRARRKFESIPDSITQGLGLTCPITPVMEGNEFFLEIDVPAALEPWGCMASTGSTKTGSTRARPMSRYRAAGVTRRPLHGSSRRYLMSRTRTCPARP